MNLIGKNNKQVESSRLIDNFNFSSIIFGLIQFLIQIIILNNSSIPNFFMLCHDMHEPI